MTPDNDNIKKEEVLLGAASDGDIDGLDDLFDIEVLQVGYIVKGEVAAKFKDFMFVKVDRVSCVLPYSEISDDIKPKTLKIGSKIEAVVVRIDKDHGVMLSIKRCRKDPWQTIDDFYSVGQHVQAKVTRISNFGAFVEFDDHIPGLIHKNFLTTDRIKNPKDIVEVGQFVEADIIEIDKERRRIQLSMINVDDNPWNKTAEKYEVGQKLNRRVVQVKQGLGVLIELEPEFNAFLHISEMGLTRKHILKNFVSEGDYLDVEIMTIDSKKSRISLTCDKTAFTNQSRIEENNE